MFIEFEPYLENNNYVDDAGINLPALPTSENTVLTGTYELDLKVDIPRGYMGLILARSSFAAMGGCIEPVPIDAGYTGNLHVFVSRGAECPSGICAQLVLLPIISIIPVIKGNLEDLQRNNKWNNSKGE